MCLPSAVGFLLLIFAFLACGIGFLAPYWVYFPGNVADKAILDKARTYVDQKRVNYDGMLGRCFAESGCVFFFQNDFEMEKEVKGELNTSDSVLPRIRDNAGRDCHLFCYVLVENVIVDRRS